MPRSDVQPRTTRMRVVAADPSVCRADGTPLTAVVEVPAERLAPGPRGYRVHVVDYDASSQTLYPPAEVKDAVRPVSTATVERDPRFHARHTYAVAMSTLARFEYALGRRVPWGFGSEGHQLKLAPHAFCDPNAFYSRRDEAILFGYFPARRPGRTIFTCLSHDVVVHETSHALLDGLRERYQAPSSLDQAAFHEGFADLVALLSVFALRELVEHVIDRSFLAPGAAPRRAVPPGTIGKADVSFERLRSSMVFALARELGQEMAPIGRSALRQSLVEVDPSPQALSLRTEVHDRGEVLVAAVLEAFVRVWSERLEAYFADDRTRFIDRSRAAEEGAACADYLLTMCIRAIDYCPPVHLEFGTFLSALITADQQLRPSDEPWHYRKHLEAAFLRYRIRPASTAGQVAWGGEDPQAFSTGRVRFESLRQDRDEAFRFVWENREPLGLLEGAFTRVISVRPCLRLAPEDGFPVRETVAEVLQQVTLRVRELAAHGVKAPRELRRQLPDQEVLLHGGLTLVFDEFGGLKYSIGDRVLDPTRPHVQRRQSERLRSLWERGYFRRGSSARQAFSALHRLQATGTAQLEQEAW